MMACPSPGCQKSCERDAKLALHLVINTVLSQAYLPLRGTESLLLLVGDSTLQGQAS